MFDKALLTLCSWKGTGRKTLVELFCSLNPEQVLQKLKAENYQGEPSADQIQKQLEVLLAVSGKTTWYGSDDFPEILKKTPDPPAVLFYSGDLAAFLARPSVAIIGSRRGSLYGRQVARKLSRDLARANVGVVSGLARGIDGEAHRGCIEGHGRTMAILGSGLDVIYPPEHKRLADRILENGGVILSEYIPETEPDGFNFPPRNRLISGISKGVVVVEAGEKSGTMITVKTAIDQGKEVFAVPGEITRASARGSNRLLFDGAQIVTCVEDVLGLLGILANDATTARGIDGELPRKIVSLLSREPMQFDTIVRRIGTTAAILQVELFKLEMAGIVTQQPGKTYSLA